MARCGPCAALDRDVEYGARLTDSEFIEAAHTGPRTINGADADGDSEILFVAYCDGEPAAAGSYFPFARSAFLMGGVVLPSYRGRGLYRALVQARLAHARAHGIPLATSHAREATSAPILEQLGFETVCRFPMYFG